MIVEPRKSALDNPPLWRHDKTFDIIRAENDFQMITESLFDPLDDFSAITAVHPYFSQPLAVNSESSEQFLESVAVLNSGSRHAQSDYQTERVNQNVAFATHYFLAAVKTSR